MRSSICWIEHPHSYRLGIMARPRAGYWLDGEIAAWKLDRVDVVLSLLEPEEAADLELTGQAQACQAHGIHFMSFPIADRGVPDMREAKAAAATICRHGADGKAVAIHCRAGIGRSSLMAGAALVLSGMGPVAAFSAIGRARGLEVPDTQAQRDWLIDFHEFVLGDDRDSSGD